MSTSAHLTRRSFISAGAALALAGGAALGASGTFAQADDAEKDEVATQADDGIDISAISGTMKVVATNETYKELFDVFAAETGVKVDLLSMSSGEVLSKLRAEGGTPSADLWFGGGIDAFMSAKADGLLAECKFAGAEELAERYRDADGCWFSKGLTIVGFVVNDQLLEELGIEAPAAWSDLTDPQYKGELVMSNPAVSGTNYAVVNALLQTLGEEKGWEYFGQLNENIAYYSKRGSDPSTKVFNGEYALGITYIDNTLDEQLEANDCTIIYPADGIPWMPDGVAAFANADNTDAARAFIKWLYTSDEHLTHLAQIDKKTSVKIIKPNLEGVELDYDTEILLEEDLALFGSQRAEILEKFEALMGDKVENA